MTEKSFQQLKREVRDSWSTHAETAYQEASQELSAELSQRKELGILIASARKEHKLSQQQLAHLADIQQAEVSRIERGLSNPTIDTLSKILSTLGKRLTIA